LLDAEHATPKQALDIALEFGHRVVAHRRLFKCVVRKPLTIVSQEKPCGLMAAGTRCWGNSQLTSNLANHAEALKGLGEKAKASTFGLPCGGLLRNRQ
jgi:hypothetical protein